MESKDLSKNEVVKETDWSEWEGVKDELKLSKEEKYDLLIARRKKTINKYHKSDKGIVARKKAQQKYYEANKEKILAKKKEAYLRNRKKRSKSGKGESESLNN